MQDDYITVTLRSHITPSIHIDGFAPGKKFPVKLPVNTTVKDLLQKFFFQKEVQIGFVAINGMAAAADTVLKEGDLVDLYSLIPGG